MELYPSLEQLFHIQCLKALEFHLNVFLMPYLYSTVKLNRRDVQRKADALKAYESQKSRDYMQEEFIFSLAKTRGVQIGEEFAESFEVVRWMIK